MARYITRVELHQATSADYDTLHLQMIARRFQRTIPGADGRNYQLPSATYYSFGELTANQVGSLAKTAANLTGRQSWVLTLEYTASAFDLSMAQ